jgi:nicotinic acetylcholine receptor
MKKTALFVLTIVRKREIKRESNDMCIFCSLQQIVDLDEKNQILTSNIWLNLDWVDYSLVWNASEYGGVKVGMVIQNPLQ